MSRVLTSVAVWLLWVCAGLAQGLTALARAETEGSYIRDVSGGAEIVLQLNQGVPYRVFTLDGPPRLVVDFSEVDFSGLQAQQFLAEPGFVEAVRLGAYQPGWSRLVADLSTPMVPDSIGMDVDDLTGRATLEIGLQGALQETFAAQAGAPTGVFGAVTLPSPSVGAPSEDRFVVVLDPGHGGVDPGAERGGLIEKVLVLEVAKRVEAELRRAGVKVVLTRDRDMFVSLERRTAIAHQAGASVFVSIHADALSQGGAHGATVYTLSDKASDAASALLAERHNRSDILAGVDLSGADDEVTAVLLDIARQETEPRSEVLARVLIEGMAQAGGPMNRKPWRRAGFSVLKSADIPSALVEIGFLSSERDQKNLADPDWRAGIAAGLARAILEWRDADAARQHLVRK